MLNMTDYEKISDSNKRLKQDLDFARRTENAFKRYEKGEFIEMEFDEFLNEMKKL